MTNKLEQDKAIIAGAPEGATHYCCGTYCKANKDFFYDWDGEYWCAYFVPDGDMRSLADIEAIVEKDKKIAKLEESLRTVAQTRCVSYEDLAKRDLEQQAKGIEDALELFQSSYADTKVYVVDLISRIEKLREQAKGGDL